METARYSDCYTFPYASALQLRTGGSKRKGHRMETAKSLGWIDDTAQPDEACGKEPFYALMDAMVKQRTGNTCEWIDWQTGDPMQRLYVPRVLYEAALNMGYLEKDSARQDIVNINDPMTMECRTHYSKRSRCYTG